MPDPRLAELRIWIATVGKVAGGDPVPASSDASFRRYFRVPSGDGSLIVMDAPPGKEDCVPFVRVSGYLEAMGLTAPRVLEADLAAGFLLLSDLGQQQYLETLKRDPSQAPALYADAIAALLSMQRRGTAFQAHLPPYDDKLLRFELSLFHDWLCGKHLGIATNTLVLFTGDNGPLPTYEHRRTAGLRGSKLSLYEGGLREPLLVLGEHLFFVIASQSHVQLLS